MSSPMRSTEVMPVWVLTGGSQSNPTGAQKPPDAFRTLSSLTGSLYAHVKERRRSISLRCAVICSASFELDSTAALSACSSTAWPLSSAIGARRECVESDTSDLQVLQSVLRREGHIQRHRLWAEHGSVLLADGDLYRPERLHPVWRCRSELVIVVDSQ